MSNTHPSSDPEANALDAFERHDRTREPRQSKVADAFDAFLSAEAEEREFHRNMKAMLEDALGLADEETEQWTSPTNTPEERIGQRYLRRALPAAC